MNKLILALCLALLCVFPALAQTVEHNEGVWYRLHLGTGVGDKAVSTELLKSFIDKEICPKFPDGLTIIEARGQWKSEEYGVIRERTIIIDLHCPDTDDCREKIAAIAKAYADRFKAAKASIYVIRVGNVSTALYY